ncbi:unnamed protein product [Macrosiphum euphorbiae]|uniref:Uncharacterized protein n=1 Tax=Macrosiphum euphorbiae TaxID=13131 RepID=A0AAV0X9Z9_9HEMI|nr:unnamed protein product [Macrosiphum euphorbiae]
MTCTWQRQLGRCEITDLSQDASQRRDVELTNAHGHGEQYRTAAQKGPHACEEHDTVLRAAQKASTQKDSTTMFCGQSKKKRAKS